MCSDSCETTIRSIGVDVAKAEVVIAELGAGGACRHRRVANTAQALEGYLAPHVRQGFTGPVIVESTGYWHWPTVFTAQALGLDVRLLNPLMAAKHRQGEIRLCKTDPSDARILATMGVTEPRLPARCRLTRAQVRVRQLLNLQKQLERLIQSQQAILNAHREAAELAGVTPTQTLAGLDRQLHDLKAQRQALQAEIQACAKQQAELAHVRCWAQLPGVTEQLAAVLASILDPQAPSANSWVAFVGLDISVHRSGQRVGRSRLTKRGHAFLRKRLFQAAWGAVMNHAAAKAYYQALRQAGRPYKEAILIIARKLLRAAYALIHNPGESVDVDRLFAVKT